MKKIWSFKRLAKLQDIFCFKSKEILIQRYSGNFMTLFMYYFDFLLVILLLLKF